MLSSFGNKFTEGLAGIWNTRVLTPALVFWAGGLYTWGLTHLNERKQFITFFTSLQLFEAISLLIAALLLVIVSNDFVTWMTPLLLRIFEGYWTGPFYGLRFYMVRGIKQKLAAKERDWEELSAAFQANELNPRQRERYASLETELASYPVEHHRLLPTRLGNILRAAEEYPYLRYGLEVTVVWTRLWLVLPQDTQAEIAYARRSLDERIRLLAWGVFFLVWCFWAWWVVPMALIFCYFLYISSLAAATVYGDLIRSAFDLYRFDLYQFLKLAMPPSPSEEEEYGKALTNYLCRGTISSKDFLN